MAELIDDKPNKLVLLLNSGEHQQLCLFVNFTLKNLPKFMLKIILRGLLYYKYFHLPFFYGDKIPSVKINQFTNNRISQKEITHSCRELYASPSTLCTPQLQSTCHYIVNNYVKIWHVRLGGANNMRPLRSWGGAQTEKIRKIMFYWYLAENRGSSKS